MSKRELYFISGSPPCWTVMLALEVKGWNYRPRRLDNSKREQNTRAFLTVNPRGQVPVLIDSDLTVCETTAILCYLDTETPTPPLFGGRPAETALIWQTIAECNDYLQGPIGEISRPLFRGKGVDFKDQIADAAAKVRGELGLLEVRLSSTPWIAGDALSAADLVVYPTVDAVDARCRARGRGNAQLFGIPAGPVFSQSRRMKRAHQNLAGVRQRLSPALEMKGLRRPAGTRPCPG
jgi:glutathione S-transferase